MEKIILMTGATDGIGLEAALRLARGGHKLLLHGRSESKLEQSLASVRSEATGAPPQGFLADLSELDDVEALATALKNQYDRLDVLINNAGVYKTPETLASNGQDVRFMVNTLSPYLLTRRLKPLLGATARVINLASAAQEPVNVNALKGEQALDDMNAYAQSKLAIIEWTRHLAREYGKEGPMLIAVNPGSLLASKMVQEGFGIAGNDIGIGADILCRIAIDEEFADASGRYFDNDAGEFAEPQNQALDDAHCANVVAILDELIIER